MMNLKHKLNIFYLIVHKYVENLRWAYMPVLTSLGEPHGDPTEYPPSPLR